MTPSARPDHTTRWPPCSPQTRLGTIAGHVPFSDDIKAVGDGRVLKLLNVVDEYTRECLAIVVDRPIDADRVVDTLDPLVLTRGAGVRPVRQRPRVHR